MNNIQKEPLLLGYDFTDCEITNICPFYEIYHTDTQYIKVFRGSNYNKKGVKPLMGAVLDLKESDVRGIDNSFCSLFAKVKSINLFNNKIEDISWLHTFNLKNLVGLGLHSNNISDISILESLNLENLEILYISNNKISDYSPLLKLNAPRLKILSLGVSGLDAELREKFPGISL